MTAARPVLPVNCDHAVLLGEGEHGAGSHCGIPQGEVVQAAVHGAIAGVPSSQRTWSSCGILSRMLIDLPHDPAERWSVLRPMWDRSTDHATPEVFIFRPGRFTYAELVNDPSCDRLEARLAKKHDADEGRPHRDAQWQQQMKALEAYFGAGRY